ncbi:MAG: GH1 family beta-glucosidase [Bacteroidota bacterium]
MLRILLLSLLISGSVSGQSGKHDDMELFRSFGEDFLWGTSCSAYQIEGAWNEEGRGPSIWDEFSQEKGNTYNNENGNVAVDFYHRYKEDIRLLKEMNFKVFRFSISWSRILPNGTGEVNQKGVEFYHNVIDECKRQGIEPWITLYHWDLPLALHNQGGWTNRDVVKWFSDYTAVCAKEYGTKVKNWMVFNEPAAFVGLGYLLGYHAPGKKSVSSFLKATHHTCLAMAESGRTIRSIIPDAIIGTNFSCSYVDAYKGKQKHNKAVRRLDAMLNRMFIEPSLGLGYPEKDLPFLKKIRKYMKDDDEDRLKFAFDFIGLQNYFRVVVKKSPFIPIVWARQINATKRDVPVNEMGFEIYPEGIYKVMKQFSAYEGVKDILITENGVCVKDSLVNGKVHDPERIQFFRDYLEFVLKAKSEGVPVKGYFVWSLTDNFEWSEGYEPRFGLVYVDYKTQERYIKDSGIWFRDQLKK